MCVHHHPNITLGSQIEIMYNNVTFFGQHYFHGVHDPSLIQITPVKHNDFRNKYKHEKLKIELTNRRESRMIWSTKISYI